ncbi:hypothetical protein CONCODRAFT_9437 [Conidiobolus coronatus NRRL 28638]|uniref:Uncharacterized protein n=1 Tax=Conidiobolus coronatus (strain ATCC 28846 / CBS 209.66 / NRRL 28638) TaxID=796925 RepID=A0A137P0C6_CONC2|nr:hypothetical protein CONCODRAFT_9437 [Conidiobolus coronatus NRRL 28638]|eukprot:KXN68324.1 hypothetical protein CONCODRAFT_9437 [Conidiobolus coronatus NRRL 28638]
MKSITLLALLTTSTICSYQEQSENSFKVNKYSYYSNPESYEFRANSGSNLERRRRRKNNPLYVGDPLYRSTL